MLRSMLRCKVTFIFEFDVKRIRSDGEFKRGRAIWKFLNFWIYFRKYVKYRY